MAKKKSAITLGVRQTTRVAGKRAIKSAVTGTVGKGILAEVMIAGLSRMLSIGVNKL